MRAQSSWERPSCLMGLSSPSQLRSALAGGLSPMAGGLVLPLCSANPNPTPTNQVGGLR